MLEDVKSDQEYDEICRKEYRHRVAKLVPFEVLTAEKGTLELECQSNPIGLYEIPLAYCPPDHKIRVTTGPLLDTHASPSLRCRRISNHALILRRSNRISEIHIIPNDHLTPVRLPIAPPEMQRQHSRNQDHHTIRRDRRDDARNIFRCVLATEDKAASNAANTTQTSESSRAESSLPLSTDVVCLVGHGGRDISVDACSADEDAEVLDAGIGGEAHDWQTDEGNEGVEDEDGGAGSVLVAVP